MIGRVIAEDPPADPTIAVDIVAVENKPRLAIC